MRNKIKVLPILLSLTLFAAANIAILTIPAVAAEEIRTSGEGAEDLGPITKKPPGGGSIDKDDVPSGGNVNLDGNDKPNTPNQNNNNNNNGNSGDGNNGMDLGEVGGIGSTDNSNGNGNGNNTGGTGNGNSGGGSNGNGNLVDNEFGGTNNSNSGGNSNGNSGEDSNGNSKTNGASNDWQYGSKFMLDSMINGGNDYSLGSFNIDNGNNINSYADQYAEAQADKRNSFRMTLGEVTEITGNEFVNYKGVEAVQKNLYQNMDLNIQSTERGKIDPNSLMDKSSATKSKNSLYFISKRDTELPWYTYIIIAIPAIFILSFIPATKNYYEACIEESVRNQS